MGAVFAIFSGFYFWFEKMWGITYSEFLGKLHFTLFFIGVNVTFFPMHFMGLAGMPRRIADYHEAFAGWNKVASMGAMISVVATVVFFVLLLHAFIRSEPSKESGYANANHPDAEKRVIIIPAKLYNKIVERSNSTIKSFGALLVMISNDTLLGVAENNQLSFQMPASPIMEGIIDLHHDIMFFLVFISLFVLYLLLAIISLFSDSSSNRNTATFAHHTALETIWTIIPTIILIFIAVPSLALLYSMDELHKPTITLKVIGRQWYWSYEYSDTNIGIYDPNLYNNHPLWAVNNISFDSYMDQDIEDGFLRLLKTDNDIYLPTFQSIRVLVTSSDVIHSWAIPALGVKVDACPGRLNQVSLFIERVGYYFGQCSELCGLNHAFMPISLLATPLEVYINWLISFQHPEWQ